MKSRRLFRFCAGRLKVIFLIVSKAVASFSQPLMPGVRRDKPAGHNQKGEMKNEEENLRLINQVATAHYYQ